MHIDREMIQAFFEGCSGLMLIWIFGKIVLRDWHK